MSMPITIDKEEYLTTDESADFLGVSKVTFLRLRERYKLIPKKRPVGRTLYYKKDDLQKIMDEMAGFEDVTLE